MALRLQAAQVDFGCAVGRATLDNRHFVQHHIAQFARVAVPVVAALGHIEGERTPAQVIAQRKLAVDLRARELESRIALMSALGGGWQDDTASVQVSEQQAPQQK